MIVYTVIALEFLLIFPGSFFEDKFEFAGKNRVILKTAGVANLRQGLPGFNFFLGQDKSFIKYILMNRITCMLFEFAHEVVF